MVLGSATPSLEAFYRCERGEYVLLRLPSRAGRRTLPRVRVADMREELKKGNRSIFSDSLRELMADRLQKGAADHALYQPARLRGLLCPAGPAAT